jgi:PhzF family phenazine biosynthesis protein
MAQVTYVDAFADGPFTGNPAAVCVLPRATDAVWMQRVAAELNLAETAFVTRRADANFDLRWFSPEAEVDLCGHATLASAHVLWESGLLAPGSMAHFHTRSGMLTAAKVDQWIELDFPITPAEPAEAPPGMIGALGVEPRFVARSRFDYLVEVADHRTVETIAPDFAKLRLIATRGVIVTARSAEPAYDFVSRFFGPAVGINEDPATGSAHCSLAPFWQTRLGKSSFLARQLSRRGATIRVRLDGDRVKLAGCAITMLAGQLTPQGPERQ